MTEGEREVRNVHQRKLAVMRRCDAIKPDKLHPHHKYEYNSIQNISNHLRVFCAEEGLDIEPSIEGDTVFMHLINVDYPQDRWTSRFPVVADDKGHAYTIKFALVRMFLIGDGEEGDESEMARRSGQRRPEPLRRPEPRPIPEQGTPSERVWAEVTPAVDVNEDARQVAIALATEYLLKTNAAAKKLGPGSPAVPKRAEEWVGKLYQAKYHGDIAEAPIENLASLTETIRERLDDA